MYLGQVPPAASSHLRSQYYGPVSRPPHTRTAKQRMHLGRRQHQAARRVTRPGPVLGIYPARPQPTPPHAIQLCRSAAARGYCYCVHPYLPATATGAARGYCGYCYCVHPYLPRCSRGFHAATGVGAGTAAIRRAAPPRPADDGGAGRGGAAAARCGPARGRVQGRRRGGDGGRRGGCAGR
jgi:hypothetical protein